MLSLKSLCDNKYIHRHEREGEGKSLKLLTMGDREPEKTHLPFYTFQYHWTFKANVYVQIDGASSGTLNSYKYHTSENCYF